jgi:hypothetical protein
MGARHARKHGILYRRVARQVACTAAESEEEAATSGWMHNEASNTQHQRVARHKQKKDKMVGLSTNLI